MIDINLRKMFAGYNPLPDLAMVPRNPNAKMIKFLEKYNLKVVENSFMEPNTIWLVNERALQENLFPKVYEFLEGIPKTTRIVRRRYSY